MRTYPKIKETQFNGKELTLGKNFVLTIGKKYYDKNQASLYRELFKKCIHKNLICHGTAVFYRKGISS